MSLADTLLQLLFCFIVSTVSGAYLPHSYVGYDGLLHQHFPENVCSAFIIIIIIIIIIYIMIVTECIHNKLILHLTIRHFVINHKNVQNTATTNTK